VSLHVFDNPIIGRVKAVLDNLECNPSFLWNSHPRVGDQCDIKAISACDAVHLLFDRARISIDKYVQQTKILFITSDLVREQSNGSEPSGWRGRLKTGSASARW
jgi:hypothetical protein